MGAIIFDTETTGGEPPQMIEAGWIRLAGDEEIDLRAAETFEQRYNPGVPSTLGALATHHILDVELEGMPSPETFALPEGTKHLVGHNVDYDWRVLGEPEIKRICTLAMARWLWPEADSHSLGAMAYHLLDGATARDMLRGAHSALSDCETTRWLLRYIVSAGRARGAVLATWDDLWAFSEQARIPVFISFGKHKGTRIAELPKDYIDWLLKERRKAPESDQDPYLVRALSQAYLS